MDIVQAAFGTFHHFDLARELRAHGYLKRIYSTYPWKRLKREGIPRNEVSVFPWLHMVQLGLGRFVPVPRAINHSMSYAIATTFDRWIAATIPECHAFVGLSGAGLKSGQLVQRRGGRYVCDRGSSHMRYQNIVMNEEYARWGFPFQTSDPRIIDREEAEYAAADAITIASEFSRRSFLEMGVPAEKIYKIAYGVGLDRFRPASAPEKNAFNILFAGTVSLRKGVPYLVEAFQQFRHPAKKLLLVGPVEPAAKEVLDRLDLTGVEIPGRMPQPQLAEYMQKSHVLVLPSIEDGFGLVMAQAMACGCPVISSENTGGPDLITEGIDGFVVPIRSAAAIAERFQQMADDPALQERMRAAALVKVKSFGGWHEYGLHYIDFLKQLTKTG